MSALLQTQLTSANIIKNIVIKFSYNISRTQILMNFFQKAVSSIGTITRWCYPVLLAVALVMSMTIVGKPILTSWRELPSELPEINIAGRNTILDSNGDVIARVWNENRKTLDSIEQISKFAVDALIATEDSRFYENNGVDVKGTIRAAVSGEGGGSGITQQLVKNLLYFDIAGTNKTLATEQSIERKIRELKLAMQYDETHSKEEILVEYFNLVAFGSPSRYGIESAAQYFFGKPASDLNIEESAVLVGSVQNSSMYNLESNDPEVIERYISRKDDVLARMLEEGYITKSQHKAAKENELKFVFKRESGGTCAQGTDPFYCEYALDYIRNSPRYGETREEREMLLAKGGLTIKTHLDPEVQNIVHDQLVSDYGLNNRIAVPTAIVKPGSGGVSAMSANRNYGTNADNGETLINLARKPIGTGSVFKMVTLGAAAKNGYGRNDLTISSECPLYTPGYDMPPGGFNNSNSCALQGGTLDYKKATAYSSNTWYVTLEKAIGVEAVKEFAASIGLPAGGGITERSLSYTLGTTEHDAISMAAAFATFANNGVYCPATPVMSVSYEDGSTPAVPDTYDGQSDKCRSVMSPEDASIVAEAMRANVSGEVKNAFGINHKVPGYDTAGKSGTNESQNSSWLQMSGNYVLYNNAFDPITPANGIENFVYQGNLRGWGDHVVGNTGRDTLKRIFDAKGYRPLNYGSTDDEETPNILDQENFFTVPSVYGSKPEEAVDILEKLGLEVHVSKERVLREELDDKIPSGVVVSQSIEANTRLTNSTDKIIELKLSE